MTEFDEVAAILTGVELSSLQWSPSLYRGGGVVTTRSCDGFTTICDRLGIPARKRGVRTLPGSHLEATPEHFAETDRALIRHICWPHIDCGRRPDDPLAQDDLFGGVA